MAKTATSSSSSSDSNTTAGPDPHRAAVSQLETQMSVLARRLESTSRQSSPHRKFDRAGYLVARTLDVRGPISVNQLAQILRLDGSTVTRQVTPLVEQGYVERNPDPNDGRAIVLRLTPAGRKEMKAMRASRVESLGRHVADWEPDDLETLADLLERLNISLAIPATTPEP